MIQKGYGVDNGSGIYKITNIINGKIYVGKTVNFRRRWAIYNSAIRKQDIRKINQRFLNSINKYGSDNFVFDVLERCKIPLTSERELFWIASLNSTNEEDEESS